MLSSVPEIQLLGLMVILLDEFIEISRCSDKPDQNLLIFAIVVGFCLKYLMVDIWLMLKFCFCTRWIRSDLPGVCLF